MLVLNRKAGQRVMIGNGITVTVLETRGGGVKLGFSGPSEIPIHREEIFRRLDSAFPSTTMVECG